MGRTIIKFGTLGTISGVDIDTANFNGNEAPASDVWGANVPAGQTIPENSPLVRAFRRSQDKVELISPSVGTFDAYRTSRSIPTAFIPFFATFRTSHSSQAHDAP